MPTDSPETGQRLPPDGSRLRQIGFLPLLAIFYGYTAGGPFGYEAIFHDSGPGMALVFLAFVPFFWSIPISLASAELNSILPVQGGFYRWSRVALGDFWGFQCGWWNWTGTFLVCAAYGVTMADYLNEWIPLHSPLAHWLAALLFIVLVGYLNIRGIHVVGNLTLALLLVMFIPLIIFIIAGFRHAHFSPFHPFLPPGVSWQSTFGPGLAIALWSYAGYEQLSTIIEEVENPARNFVIGLAIITPISIAIYVVTLAAGLSALGNWQDWQTGYLVTAARLIGGGALGAAVFGAAMIGSFALLDSSLLSVTRLPLTMAEDGYFHPALGQVNPRFGTPVRSILLSTALCGALAVFTVPQLIAIYAWTRMATSVQTVLSFWRLRRMYPDAPRTFRAPGGRLATFLIVVLPTFLFVWAMYYSDVPTRKWGALNLASGPAAYWLIRFWQRRARA